MTIVQGLSPNLTKKDILISISYLFSPWKWKKIRKGEFQNILKDNFSKKFGFKFVFPVGKGREALFLALKILDLEENDEVILQGFTCTVVPRSVILAGGKPVFVDIDESLNIDINDLEKKITNKTRAIIIQHTLGIPFTKFDDLRKIIGNRKIVIIEDCAHSIGAKVKEKFVGNFGELAVFSFGRDKVLSSVNGGVLATNNETLAQKIENYLTQNMKERSLKDVAKDLLHPIITGLIVLPLYDFFFFGKFLLFLLQKLHILSKPISKKEILLDDKKNTREIVTKFPSSLCEIALNQLENLDMFNKKRIETAKKYYELIKFPKQKFDNTSEPIFLRFSFFYEYPKIAKKIFKKEKIYLGSFWYEKVISPKGSNLDKLGYKIGSCLKAESFSKKVVNLPTNKEIDIKKLGKILDKLDKLTRHQK